MANANVILQGNAVVGVFTAPQPDSVVVAGDDPRLLAYLAGSLPAQAAAALATRIAGGIAITCAGNPALNATYALDGVTLDQVGSVARDSACGLGLPGGGGTFTYPDRAGTPRAFTGTQLIALYKAQRDLIFALDTQAAVMAQGGTPVWPGQSATIP